MTAYMHRFTVTGIDMFPLDMLRYDGCHPSHEADASSIHHTFCRPLQERTHAISLSRIGDKGWKPTEGRWQSFGWKVVAIEKPVKLP